MYIFLHISILGAIR